MIESPYVLWFSQCTRESLPRVGGKNASLGEMLKAGIPVPPGFAVTTDAFREFLMERKINERIRDILSKTHRENKCSLDDASKDIRALIESVAIPEKIEDAIRFSYAELSGQLEEDNLAVAVRSSATAEDLPGASFAGQQDTFLWIKGIDEVIRKTQQCWGSLFTPRAISYRKKMGFPHKKTLISVGIQKMIDAEAAGVMFTLNPTNGDPSKIAIDANWGLGESVVQGEVVPDSYIVDKVTLEIIKRTISKKSFCYKVNDQTEKVDYVEVPSEKQMIGCLADQNIIELARLGKSIEQYYGSPQDIEWAIDIKFSFPENIFIVQSRPETVWSQKKPEPLVKEKKTAMELILDRYSKSE